MRLPVALFLLISASLTLTQEPARAPVSMRSPVQDKNFYLLSLLERSQPLQAALMDDIALRRIRATKLETMQAAAKCTTGLTCYTQAVLWTPDEVETVEHSLRALCRKSEAFRDSVTGPMRGSGLYQLHTMLEDEELLAWAWEDAAKGVNRAILTYGEGVAPRYPAIDSVAYDVKTDDYRHLIHIILTDLLDEVDAYPLFFQPSLQFGLRLMEASKRDEAGRFEPMEKGENKAAFERVKSIRWNDYEYSAIVVPGAGTDRLSWDISQWGRERLRLAARRYRDRKAPFVIVSGGFVHPDQTPHAEAIEMKKVLISEFGVPENAIIVEPHARHTTTNLRNAARLMWRYGLPFDKPGLITTDIYQSIYIEGDEFRIRCDKELGYQPHQRRGRKSDFDLEFLPRLDSLQADSSDLLDP